MGDARAERLRTAAGHLTAAGPEAHTTVRCFGGLAASVRSVPLDLTELRPRARSVLGLLAVNAGRPVHREVLAAALWPDLPGDDVWARIHVAVSGVRRAFATAGARGVVTRHGDGYVLASDVDVRRFDELAATAARARGGPDERPLLAEVAASYAGDLLPEAGPAEWVVHERYHRRSLASDACERLAALALAAGDGSAAVAAARRGLRVDPYRDGLWQALIAGLRACGHRVALARARDEYSVLLAEAERR
jgi:DNA-binding SARP family transcriptional activator